MTAGQERRVSNELIADAIKVGQEEELLLQQIAEASDQDADSARVSGILDEVAEARDFRRRAALLIRCQDCRGLTIAHVTYVRDRPMLWTRQEQGPGSRMWLDGGFWGDVAHCRSREYVLNAGVLLDQLKSEDRDREIRLTH